MQRAVSRLLSTIAWCLGLLLGTAAHADPAPAQRGAMDLRGWDFQGAGSVDLDGEWLLSPGRFDDPAAPDPADRQPIAVPGPWPMGSGYGTYALTVACDNARNLALLVPAQNSALRLYINGQLSHEQGRPGTDAAQARPQMVTRIVQLEAGTRCPLRLVAQVSNFDDARGGLVHSVRLGDERVLVMQRGRGLAVSFALVCGLGLLGVLPLAFYAVRRTDRAGLWFGLFCLAGALYTGLTNDDPLERLMAGMGWEIHQRLRYLAWYLSTPFLLLLLRRLFPGELDQRLSSVALAATLAPAALVLLTPARVYTATAGWMQPLAFAVAVYLCAGLLRSALRRRPGGVVFGIGMLAFATLQAADLADFPGQLEWQLAPYGIFCFVLAATTALAQRVARALSAEELRALEQRHRANLLVKATRAGILDWDATSNTVSYSERFKEMLGHPPDADTSGWPLLFEWVHPDERDAVQQAFGEQLRDGSVRGGYREHPARDYRLRRADGSYIWVHAEAIALVGRDGRTLRFICSLIDITEQREMAAQLAQQNEVLKEHVRLREEVERIGRHDLKTPLNSIIAVPRLLREQHRLPPEDEELLGIVERAGYRVLNLVNLSLDLFRMEQGRYPFQPQPVDLLDVLRTVLADVRPHAATKGVTLQLHADGAEPGAGTAVHAWAEELLCYSILANLVKNAVEAVPERGVVAIDLRSGNPLVLEIHNAGTVPESVRERFFEKYATAGKSDGTGLGTYSARLMARVQGGELSMRTSQAEGTVLTLTLPAATAAQALAQQERASGGAVAEAPLRPADLPACRVLLVDDDEYNLLVMRRYLPTPPLQVITAVNGRAALDAALQGAPDLVLIDLDMPVMDGLEAARRLREHQRAGRLKPCVIVMLSSHDDPGTRERALLGGCDLYLCKPVSKETLLRTVQWAVSAERRAFRPAAEAATAAVQIDPDLLDRLPAFLASRRELLQALQAASAAGDGAAVRRHAHRLAGSFALYGLHWAAEQARRIELQALSPAELSIASAELLRHLDDVQSGTLAAAAVDPARA